MELLLSCRRRGYQCLARATGPAVARVKLCTWLDVGFLGGISYTSRKINLCPRQSHVPFHLQATHGPACSIYQIIPKLARRSSASSSNFCLPKHGYHPRQATTTTIIILTALARSVLRLTRHDGKGLALGLRRCLGEFLGNLDKECLHVVGIFR